MLAKVEKEVNVNKIKVIKLLKEVIQKELKVFKRYNGYFNLSYKKGYKNELVDIKATRTYQDLMDIERVEASIIETMSRKKGWGYVKITVVYKNGEYYWIKEVASDLPADA